MICTLDAISDGRAELGLGAGWKRDEWLAYGYGFPDAPERLAILKDQLEVARAMMTDRPARPYEGAHRSVDNAINKPAPVQQPWVPIMVGGNGPNVTWRLAAKYADELNLDGMTPDEVRDALPTIRASAARRSAATPTTLKVSVHVWWESLDEPTGQQRVDMIAAYRELGISRLIGMIRGSAESNEALAAGRTTAAPPARACSNSTEIGS